MVRLRTFEVRSAKGLLERLVQRGLNIEALNNLTLGSIFFNLCEACQVQTMASIPPSAFSAGRIRETQRNMKVSNPNPKGGRNDSGKVFNASMIVSPLKYNSKLMNSIWGFYNRYSPHNVKKINDAFVFNVELEQSATNSTTSIKKETVTKLPTSKFDNMWAAINSPQSH